jgi:hypothetical protein
MNDSEQLYAVYQESKHEPASKFQQFAQKRESGAKKIADAAHAKGGPAMLTYHHFKVKLPHYKKAIAGEFDAADAKKQLKQLMKQLNAAVNGTIKMQQIEFQKNVGLIEVLGELLIFNQQ